MRLSRFTLAAAVLATIPAAAQEPPPLVGALHKMPVREVTIFKDGHAFVLHEGNMPVDANGEVVLRDLPTPVVGTFWPYATTGRLKSVVASRQSVVGQRTALSVRELLKANVGADVTIIESDNQRFDAKILSVPEPPPQDDAPVENAAVRDSVPSETVRESEVVLLATKEGVRARPLNSINELIFKVAPHESLANPEFRNLLRLQFEGNKRKAGESAGVGMVYLQKGLRWIPNYRLSLDGKGRAGLKLQATLINELVDLDNATANMVIGVPSFAFKETVDPISLQNTLARLSPFFDASTRSANAFSNAIQAQMSSNSYGRINDGADDNGTNNANLSTDGGGSEDFYVFTAKGITLRKGERMAFPISQSDLRYQDIYTLEAPAQPPVELYSKMNASQQSLIKQAVAASNVMHKIRLFNEGKEPLTTAPTLIESGGRLLAQTMMTYTATGGRSDIDLAPAVDVTVKRSETEVKRTANALRWRDYAYSRVDISGKMVVTSYRSAPVTMELAQQFVGNIDSVGEKGTTRKLGIGDDENKESALPSWWNADDGDWRGVNNLSAAKWTVTIPAKGKLEIPYTYHYFWR